MIRSPGAPTVRFAPTNMSGFLATLNLTFDVWTSRAAAGDYAEGYVLVRPPTLSPQPPPNMKVDAEVGTNPDIFFWF